jgi:hypothetical protein
MRFKRLLQAFGTSIAIAGFLLLCAALVSPRLHAARDERRDDDAREDKDGDDARIEQGLRIAPVHLTYSRRNRQKVGLGSYLVNVPGGCNGCHSAGPATEYAAGGNPYFVLGAPPPKFSGIKAVNPDTYLGGGRDFGLVGGVDIVSRNLTPDHTGLPEGGAGFGEFYDSLILGIDHDHLHPAMSFPFDGAKLQVMPWPATQGLTNHDLEAIYEYLKAVPCIPGTPIPGTGNPAMRNFSDHVC